MKALQLTRRSIDRCKFCHIPVNLDEEGNTYADGSCAHEECADSDCFQKANSYDFRN